MGGDGNINPSSSNTSKKGKDPRVVNLKRSLHRKDKTNKKLKLERDAALDTVATAKATVKRAVAECGEKVRTSNVKVRAVWAQAKSESRAAQEKSEAEVQAAQRKSEAEVRAAEKKSEAEVQAAEKKSEAEVQTAQKKSEAEVGAAKKKSEAEVQTA